MSRLEELAAEEARRADRLTMQGSRAAVPAARRAALLRAADAVVKAAELEHNKYVSSHICSADRCHIAAALAEYKRIEGGGT